MLNFLADLFSCQATTLNQMHPFQGGVFVYSQSLDGIGSIANVVGEAQFDSKLAAGYPVASSSMDQLKVSEEKVHAASNIHCY